MLWTQMPPKVIDDYLWENGWLYEGKKPVRSKRISNYYVQVVENLNGNNGQVFLKLLFVIGENEQSVEKIVALENFKHVDVIKDVSYLCIEEHARKSRNVLFQLLQLQLEALENVGFYIDTIGWHYIDEKWLYCAGDKIYKESDEISVNIKPELEAEYRLVYRKRDTQAILECLKMLIQRNDVSANICLTFLVTGVLKSIFADVQAIPQFVLFLVGPTACGKTTTASYFFDMYNRDVEYSFALSELNSTKVSIEYMLDKFKDCVYIIDDLAQGVSQQETKEWEKTASKIIRTAANSNPRKYMSGYNVKEYDSQGMIVFTAEKIIDVPSLINRTFLLDMGKFPIRHEILKFMELDKLFIPTFINDFLSWSSKNIQEIKYIIENYWKPFRKTNTDDKKYDIRLKNTMYILHISAKIIQKYYESRMNDLQTAEEIYSKLHDAIAIVGEYENNVLKEINKKNKEHNFAEILYSLVEDEKINVAPSQKEFVSSEYDAYFKSHKKYLCIKPECLRRKIVKFTENQQITTNAIGKYFSERGLLRIEGNYNKSKQVNGLGRFYFIYYQELKKELGIKD